MSQLDPANNSGWTHLHSLVQMLAQQLADTGQPVNAPRTEPPPPIVPSPTVDLTGIPMGEPAKVPPPPDVLARLKQSNTASGAGQAAVGREMDKIASEDWANRMRAGKAGKQAVGEAMDKAATQAWIDRMRAAKQAARDARMTPAESNPATRYAAGKAGTEAVSRALFPPPSFHDPNLPQGPHVRSPGKPEDEPASTE